MRVQDGRDVTFANGQPDESAWLCLIMADESEIPGSHAVQSFGKRFPIRKTRYQGQAIYLQ